MSTSDAGSAAKAGAVALLATAILAACAPAPSPTDADDSTSPPSWTAPPPGEPSSSLTFADGAALAADQEVLFHDTLEEVWDWSAQPGQTSAPEPSPGVTATRALENSGNGCTVLDELGPAQATPGTDDETASIALVTDRLRQLDTVAGPALAVRGLDEPLGEAGPTYDVARAVGRDPADGTWVMVSARVLASPGVQQVVTIRCPTGGGVDQTDGQLAMVAYLVLPGLEGYP
ncbi:hypothetical protein [Cellulomonas soli]|uniref:Lipoprotein n=1 Tax=Cellulomonas soli TaxID=931535 RepID=A0A512PBW2_9CELL|nr:hypothetical protein [Cellulomonas soli]NYI58258.1 hypothetical protein [Cellulomonas soli]GEP68678.1 hypothetical protein CSO01_13930 [Cellulomonas soli]